MIRFERFNFVGAEVDLLVIQPDVPEISERRNARTYPNDQAGCGRCRRSSPPQGNRFMNSLQTSAQLGHNVLMARDSAPLAQPGQNATLTPSMVSRPFCWILSRSSTKSMATSW